MSDILDANSLIHRLFEDFLHMFPIARSRGNVRKTIVMPNSTAYAIVLPTQIKFLIIFVKIEKSHLNSVRRLPVPESVWKLQNSPSSTRDSPPFTQSLRPLTAGQQRQVDICCGLQKNNQERKHICAYSYSFVEIFILARAIHTQQSPSHRKHKSQLSMTSNLNICSVTLKISECCQTTRLLWITLFDLTSTYMLRSLGDVCKCWLAIILFTNILPL